MQPYKISVKCPLCHKKLAIPYYCRGHVVTCPECGIEPIYVPIETPAKRDWNGVGIGLLTLLALGVVALCSARVVAPVVLALGILAVPVLGILGNLSARLHHLEALAATHVEPAPVPDAPTDAE